MTLQPQDWIKMCGKKLSKCHSSSMGQGHIGLRIGNWHSWMCSKSMQTLAGFLLRRIKWIHKICSPANGLMRYCLEPKLLNSMDVPWRGSVFVQKIDIVAQAKGTFASLVWSILRPESAGFHNPQWLVLFDKYADLTWLLLLFDMIKSFIYHMSFVYFISLKKVKKKKKKSQLNQRNKKNHSSFYVVKDSSYITSKSLIINISNRLNISIYIYI